MKQILISLLDADRRRFLKWLLGVALVLRLLYVFSLDDRWYFYDTVHYHTAAKSILAGEGFGRGLHFAQRGFEHYSLEPLYPVFLAAVYFAFGPHLLAVRIIQVALGLLLIYMTYLIARKSFGERVARIAVLIATPYPYFVFISGFLYVTGLFALLIAGAVYMSLLMVERPTAFRLLSVGVLLGLASLGRPMMFAFYPLLALWYLVAARSSILERLGHLAVIFAVAILTVTPWTIRNYNIYGKIVPIRASTNEIGSTERSVYLEKQAQAMKEAKFGGRRFAVEVSTGEDGHQFRCFLDGRHQGTLLDMKREAGTADTLYAGVIMKGGVKNPISRFRVGAADTLIVPFDEAGGPQWNLSEGLVLSGGMLVNTTERKAWDFMAVSPVAANARYIELQWGDDVSPEGVNGSGLALMLDAPDPRASGYLVWIHPWGELDLWTIRNGHPDHSVDQPLIAGFKAKDSFFKRMAKVITEDPWPFIQHFAYEFIHFWTPFPDRVRTENQFAKIAVRVVGVVTFVPLLLLFLVGLTRILPSWRAAALILAVVFAFDAGYAVFFTQVRYRIPVEPYIIIIAALGLSHLLARWLNLGAGTKSTEV